MKTDLELKPSPAIATPRPTWPAPKPAKPSPHPGFFKSKVLRQSLVAVAFLTPNLAGFLVFTFIPVFASIFLSFCEWDLLTPPRFVGLANFVKVLGFSHVGGAWKPNDLNFWIYLWNTLFLMVAIPIGIAGSLGLALALNRKIRGMVTLRAIYFLPSMCVPIAVFLLWRWLYNPDYGLINWALSQVGIRGPEWLVSTRWAKPALILAGLWAGIGGYNMVLYLAGLQNIPRDYYEAALIDGANAWQRFRHITWPLLAPTTFFIFTISVIGGFQGGFDAAYMMTGGGPAGSTTTLMFYIYNNAFDWLKMGYASTISWILFILVFGVTIINWKIGGKSSHEY